METAEIVKTVGLWAGVGVALFLGVWSSLNAKRLQQKNFEHDEEIRQQEYRQKLLDEIIEWAKEVIDTSFTLELPNTLEQIRIAKHLKRVQAAKLLLKYQTVNSLSKYMRDIALSFNESLADAVTLVANGLTEISPIIEERINDIDNKALTKKVSDLELEILNNTQYLTAVIAEIKTKGIK